MPETFYAQRYKHRYVYFFQDECSFVSLRDVERAMIVFEYLYGMMNILSPLMDEWANGEHRHVDNEDEDMVRVQ